MLIVLNLMITIIVMSVLQACLVNLGCRSSLPVWANSINCRKTSGSNFSTCVVQAIYVSSETSLWLSPISSGCIALSPPPKQFCEMRLLRCGLSHLPRFAMCNIVISNTGCFFNWASPEFAKCWPVSNQFQKNVRVPDWPSPWSKNV